MTLVQQCIEMEDIPQSFFFGVLVIIPKVDVGGVRGIGLLEVMHKLIWKFFNIWMSADIDFFEEVHGFQKKKGMYKPIYKTKIQMKMALGGSKTVYQIYLDL